MSQTKSNRTSFSPYSLMVFILWPALSVLITLINKDFKALKVVFPLFTGFLGYTMVPSPGSDVYKLIDKLDFFSSFSFWEFISYMTSVDGNMKDEGMEIFISCLSYFVGFFTSDEKILLFIYGFILGFIMIKFVQLVMSLPSRSQNTLFSSVLLIFIALWSMPVTAINGRFFLAIWIFLFSAVGYIAYEKKKFLFISLLAILVHQGFILGVAILFVWSFTKGLQIRNQLYLAFFSLSLFVPDGVVVNFAQSIDLGLSSTSAIENKIHGYSSIEYIENQNSVGQRRSQLWNLYSYSQPILKVIISFSLLFLLYKIFNSKSFNRYTNYLFFIILFYSVVNIVDGIPSLGSRYVNVLLGLSAVLLYKVEQEGIVFLPKMIKLGLFFALLVNFLVKLRIDLEHLNVFVFIVSPLALFFGSPEQSLIQFIKYII